MINLNSDHSIPQIGFGFFKLEPEKCKEIVAQAIKVGFRHFDDAAEYKNEGEVGAALSASSLPRKDMFLTSKLWLTMQNPKDVPAALEKTLKDMQTSYLDLYLIHWPFAFESDSKGI
jgi:L-glyceraldehyde reductase